MAFDDGDEGLWHEESVHAQALRILNLAPWADPVAFEASLMITRANQAHVKSMAPILEEFELSGARFSVMRVLYPAPGRRLLMGEIAKALAVTPTNVTRLVAGLAKDGLVRRRTHSKDRRAAYIELTDEGVSRFERTVPVRQRRLMADFAGLVPREKRLLIHLLTKVLMSHAERSGADFDKNEAEAIPLER